MKRKFLLPILSVCMVVALVSVGFAAWLITGNDTTDTSGGQFVTYNVTNNYFTVTIEQENQSITFGKSASATTTNSSPWFTHDGNMENESFTATFTIKVTALDTSAVSVEALLTAQNLSGITVTLTGDTAFDTAAGNNYVAYPTIKQADDNTATTTTDLATTGITLTLTGDDFSAMSSGVATATVTITFNWGSYFTYQKNIVNPYTYFNNTYTAPTETVGTDRNAADEAQKVMTAIYALNNKTYTLTLGVAQAEQAA